VLVGCSCCCFFFQDSISSIHTHFEVIFEKDNEGGEGDQEANQTNGGVFGQFGILPLVLTVCECSNTEFDKVMSWSICQTFYIASYIITKNKYENDLIKQMQMRNKQ
jgi:hypothetical protein